MKMKFITGLLLVISTLKGFSQENENPPLNALRFSPIGINEVGVTVGAEYEHYFKNNPKLSFIAPVDVTFRQHDSYWNDERTNPAYVFFRPGFKFYPSTKVRPVKYAIGSNLVIGHGQLSRYNYDNWNSNNNRYENVKNTRLGVMVTNYVNFDISRNFTMGINFGLGILYLNNTEGRRNDDGRATVQLGTNFGFKF
jgi:hypothetical protein